MMRRSRILGRSVMVKPGKSTVFFSAGAHGIGERGYYNFWTVVFIRKKWPHKATGTARASASIADPGERYRRDPRSLHKRFFDQTRPCVRRPSTRREISLWMGTHRSDARFASTLRRYLPYVRRKSWVERWLVAQEARDKAASA